VIRTLWMIVLAGGAICAVSITGAALITGPGKVLHGAWSFHPDPRKKTGLSYSWSFGDGGRHNAHAAVPPGTPQ